MVGRDDVDVVVELMGGDEPARSLIAAALDAGKPVVTANKHVLAHHGPELERSPAPPARRFASKRRSAAARPSWTPIARGLAANHIRRVRGIVNGSTNYILTADDAGEAAATRRSSRRPRRRATPRRDPSADVEGHDAANKLAVLTRLAFGAWPDIGSVIARPPSLRGDGKPGITGVSAADIAGAVALGLAIRLVATASTPGTASRIRAGGLGR